MAVDAVIHDEDFTAGLRISNAYDGNILLHNPQAIDVNLAESTLRRVKRNPQQNAAGGQQTTTVVVDVTEVVSYTPGQPIPSNAASSGASAPRAGSVAASPSANASREYYEYT